IETNIPEHTKYTGSIRLPRGEIMAYKQTRVAIVYDFDGTLAKGNMQETSFIPEIGMTPREFWKESNKLAKDNEARGA
ncbi:hypothetical protein ACFLVF_02600, partial [Chloroflexota bacterium]